MRFQGVVFDVPASWSTESADGGMRLTPAGANGSGVLEELYLLTGDPSIRSFDGHDAELAIVEVVDQMLPDATKKSGPDVARFGALDGRTWTWTGRSQFDKEVAIHAHAFLGDHVCALLVLGMPDVLARRAADVRAILGSLAKAGAGGGTANGAAGTGSDPGSSAVAAELTGQWLWFSNVNATNGGGSQTNTWITLQDSGRYQWHHDSVSSNPNGAAWGSQDETGAWSVAGDTITFRPDGGAPYTQTLEKRNHPLNRNDPMIVLDGKTYVTATARRPW